MLYQCSCVNDVVSFQCGGKKIDGLYPHESFDLQKKMMYDVNVAT